MSSVTQRLVGNSKLNPMKSMCQALSQASGLPPLVSAARFSCFENAPCTAYICHRYCPCESHPLSREHCLVISQVDNSKGINVI